MIDPERMDIEPPGHTLKEFWEVFLTAYTGDRTIDAALGHMIARLLSAEVQPKPVAQPEKRRPGHSGPIGFFGHDETLCVRLVNGGAEVVWASVYAEPAVDYDELAEWHFNRRVEAGDVSTEEWKIIARMRR